MGRIIAITGTPGTGKTKLFDQLKKSQNDVIFLEIKKIIAKNKLYIGKDKLGSKIVNINRLSKILNTLASSKYANKTVVIESHLLCDLKLRNSTAIVLREHLKTLKSRLMARGYPLAKIKDNIICEATDYCGINSAKNYKTVYEFLSSNKETSLKIKKIIKGQKLDKKFIELGEELRIMIEKDSKYAL